MRDNQTARLKFQWKRGSRIPYPNTWLTFLARDVDSDELVEYQIRDLTQDRFEEAFNIMVNEYFKNEPLNAHVGKNKKL